jgi:hypothetical protein
MGEEVFKKRLNENMHRSIVVAKGGKYWVYAFLLQKETTKISIAKTSWLPRISRLVRKQNRRRFQNRVSDQGISGDLPWRRNLKAMLSKRSIVQWLACIKLTL